MPKIYQQKKVERLEKNLQRLEGDGMDVHSVIVNPMCFSRCREFLLNKKRRAGSGKCKSSGEVVFCGSTPCEYGR